MQTQLLQNYIYLFQNLHVNKQKGMCAPHKAVMLISVMELIGEGSIKSNQIEFTEQLECRFKVNWRRFVGESDVFKPNPYSPCTIRQHIKFAVIDKQLFEFMKNVDTRALLINTLVDTLK